MVFPFPSFHGLNEEDAEDFCNNFELACLLAKYNDSVMLKAFPLVIKGEAKAWYNNISKPIKEDWSRLKESFLERYVPKETVQELLEALQWLQQTDLQSYSSYEEAFFHKLSCLELSHPKEERLPDFVIKEYFVNGLYRPLKLKVLCETPSSFNEAVQVARVKYRKLMYKLYKVEVRLPPREYVSPRISMNSPFEQVSTPIIATPQPQGKVESAQIPVEAAPLIPLEEVECIKEVHMEESSKVTRKRNCDQVNEEVQLEPQSNFTPRVVVSHRRGSKMSRSAKAEKAVRQRLQGGGIPLKVLAIESKGEGLLPHLREELAQSDVLLYDLCDGSSSTCTFSEHLCEEIVSQKSVLALVPNERQIVDQFLFQFVEDLEMGDASSPLLQFDEGQEMGDSSSGLELVSGSGGGYNIANSWEAVSNQDELLQTQDKEGLLKGSETSTVILEGKDEEEDDFEATRADSIGNSQQVNAVTSQEQRGRGTDKECLKLAVIAVVQQDFQVIFFLKKMHLVFKAKGRACCPRYVI